MGGYMKQPYIYSVPFASDILSQFTMTNITDSHTELISLFPESSKREQQLYQNMKQSVLEGLCRWLLLHQTNGNTSHSVLSLSNRELFFYNRRPVKQQLKKTHIFKIRVPLYHVFSKNELVMVLSDIVHLLVLSQLCILTFTSTLDLHRPGVDPLPV